MPLSVPLSSNYFSMEMGLLYVYSWLDGRSGWWTSLSWSAARNVINFPPHASWGYEIIKLQYCVDFPILCISKQSVIPLLSTIWCDQKVCNQASKPWICNELSSYTTSPLSHTFLSHYHHPDHHCLICIKQINDMHAEYELIDCHTIIKLILKLVYWIFWSPLTNLRFKYWFDFCQFLF